MTKTAKDILNDLDEWFVGAPYIERCRLWDVLSALRGPDEAERWDMKQKTTGWIRAYAFPKFNAQGGKPASFAYTGEAPVVNYSASNHFDIHVNSAWWSMRIMDLTPTRPGNPSDDAG